jgi:hypothetical protein
MRRIKLMPDYDCWPLWETGEDVGNIDPASLPISERLQERLEAWARRYDETLNRENPATSGFASSEVESSFEKEGVALCAALMAELGEGSEVVYFSQAIQRLLREDEIGNDI